MRAEGDGRVKDAARLQAWLMAIYSQKRGMQEFQVRGQRQDILQVV